MPPVHAFVPHATVAAVYVHCARVTPSHRAAQSTDVDVGQGARVPRGVPLIALQVPTLPATLHASH